MPASPHTERPSREAASTPRLDEIGTDWSLWRRAHQGSLTVAGPARNALVLRYNRALRRYLGDFLKDEHDADDVAQAVVLRLVSGGFAAATPEKGRFRDYLKKAARNTALNLLQEKQRQKRRLRTLAARTPPRPAEPDGSPLLEEQDQQFELHWRSTVLEHVFHQLEDHQRQHPDNLWFSLMRLRADYPEDSNDQLAARLHAATGQQFSENAFRGQLNRARRRFAELLLEELALGLKEPTPELVEEELIELGLIEYVRDLLPDDWRQRGQLRPIE